VLVTGDDFHASLALVRGLGLGGYTPVLAVAGGDTYAARSRYVREVVGVPSAGDAPEEFAHAVSEAARSRGVAAVLPGTEPSLIALARHRAAIAVPMGTPAPAMVDLATDKGRVSELAAACGLEAPASTVGAPAVLAARAGSFRYPVILKPQQSEVRLGDQRLSRFRATRIASAEALREALRGLPEAGWLIQPFIGGELSAVAGVSWRGRVVCAVHQRSPRIWPPDVGFSCYAETIPPDRALEAQVGELLRAIGWSGLFQLQLIRSAAGVPLVIDFNPRAYGSLALALGAGANLPAVWAALVLGDRPPEAKYRVGVRYRLETADARAILALARSRQFHAAASAALPRRHTVHAIASLRDAGPGLLAAGRALRKLWR
jgi:predicted ATP-grasp superfamily ATP-dependent carboligase